LQVPGQHISVAPDPAGQLDLSPAGSASTGSGWSFAMRPNRTSDSPLIRMGVAAVARTAAKLFSRDAGRSSAATFAPSRHGLPCPGRICLFNRSLLRPGRIVHPAANLSRSTAS
jgi:hypothetical protein